MNNPLPAGWGYPTGTARKEHWWAEGENRSGCGTYTRALGYHGVRPRMPSPRFTCKACERKAAAA